MRSEKTKKKRKHGGLLRRQQRNGWLFVLPWIVGFVIFFLKPLVQSLWFSFNDVTMGNSGMETAFVGLGNYKYLLIQDSSFLTNLWTVTLSMLQQVAICTVLSLFIAVVLVQKFRGRTLYRAIFFLPIIMTSGVVYSMVGSVVGSAGLSGCCTFPACRKFRKAPTRRPGSRAPEAGIFSGRSPFQRSCPLFS